MSMDGNEQPCQSPYLQSSSSSSSSSFLKDISNFKTPKRPSQFTNFTSPCPQFFTASKQTPRSSSSFRRPNPKSVAAARRLKAFELEQSQSSRKAQIKKEQSLKSLSKSLSTWLNFLFQNPGACGCHFPTNESQDSGPSLLGKRDGGPRGGVVGVDATWRSPKRLRDMTWLVESKEDAFSSSKQYGMLRNSLKEVCSLDDLKQRMRVYLSLGSCREIFDAMTHVLKNIDEGRLKMKPHCPIVTDVGMKENAMRILMCYNPIWLRIGLHIIFGGDSLLPNGDVNSDQEVSFLKMVIEKQLFSHAGLAKAYAYNKMVEGLYRPGYYETLGNVLIKRFLLLVLILDKAKSGSHLSLKYGIDGLDGGSPLLFLVQSTIKSSCQMINDFLSSEVMHGEGNLLAHLVIVGYKVSYQQCSLVEYDFRVTDLFTELQDGVRLCRAIQLLQNDTSILTKMVVPSNTRKKNLANCGVALQYLKHAGVSLYDEDGMKIMEDDVANGDKELTISLLWNMFVQLQMPLLLNKTILAEEILKIHGANSGFSNSINISSAPLELLLNWIQAVCEKYDHKVDSFSSLVDGKAIWCLLDYYFRKELSCSHSLKDPCESRGEESIMSATDYADAVHNFILSQKLTTILGDFPEVLQISEILEHSGAINDRSVVVLLVFLSSQLTVKKTMDQLNFHKLLGCNCQSPERRHLSVERCLVSSNALLYQAETDGHCTADAARKFRAIKAWWQDMAERNDKFVTIPATSALLCNSTSKSSTNVQRENAAKVIQSHFSQFLQRRNFLKKINTVTFLQTIIRAWLMVKHKSTLYKFNTLKAQKVTYERWKDLEKVGRFVKFFDERHRFVELRRSVLLIQRAARIWTTRRHQSASIRSHDVSTSDLANAAIVVQKYFRGWAARSRYKLTQMEKATIMCQFSGNLDKEPASTIPLSSKNLISSGSLHNQHLAAIKIQSCFRGWLLRRKFLNQKQAITKIQCHFRCFICWKAFQHFRIASRSAIIIQSYVRGWTARRGAMKHRLLIGVLQRCCRGWLLRRHFLFQREAAMKIQSAIRCLHCSKAFHCHKYAAIEIQRFVRGQITRNRLLGASHFRGAFASSRNLHIPGGFFQAFELKIMLSSVLKLQRWWRGVLLLKLRTKSAIVIQSHIRGWIGRQKVSRENQCVIVLQSYWKGYLARKGLRGQLRDLRLRLQKSAKNVDDSMRIINRLIVALHELSSIKSVSGILHTCATLDMATKYSQKCCEELVAAGAIIHLLRLIRSVSRSIPDQEVLKHALSTVGNLARYPHLVEVLIDTHGSVETIFWELLRNKEEGYFIASEVLKKICLNEKGFEAVHKLPGLLKRLHCLAEELTRKANIEKRNPRGVALRENTDRRLREAAELLKLITN